MTASRTAHATDSRSASQAPEPEPSSESSSRLGVSGVQVSASVMASVTAATVASFFGVAGTIIGAAVVSVFATVGSAAYGLGLRRTQARLQQVQTLRLPRLSSWPVGSTGATRAIGGNGDGSGDDVASDGDPATDVDGDGPAVDVGDGTAVDDELGLAEGTAPDGVTAWRQWLSQRRWSLAGGAALVFVLSLAAITLFEAVADRPLSGRDSGRATSIGSLLTSSTGDVDDPVDIDDGRGSPTTTVEGDGSPTPPVTGDDGSPAPGATDDPATSPSTTAPPATSPTTVPPTTAPPATSPPTTTAPEATEPGGGSAAPAPPTTAPPPG